MQIVPNGYVHHVILREPSPEMIALIEALEELDHAMIPEDPAESPVGPAQFRRIESGVLKAIRNYASRGGFNSTLENAMRDYSLALDCCERMGEMGGVS
jgi:hypothetical protein